uniref:Connector enhancer of kinase suppressor of Ras 1 n=1 Tax=Hippocampus comes TaxID=109280 RepID=A0A3Q3DFI3_HIPCM
MEPITAWSEETVCQWLQGLDAPLHRYALSEWHLSGLDLLQLTSEDLERLGVSKIGHQELILEAVEKLCSLSFDDSGENLQVLTEKLRFVAHNLQMGIQSRWRHNSYDGQSATKLSTSVLHAVLELIASAKGLFSFLNRSVKRKKRTSVYEKEKDIISVCRQLVVVCDEILSCSPQALLTNTTQLESVDLVPASPGDQLVIFYFFYDYYNDFYYYYIIVIFSVGWSRANLVKKLRENPSGVNLVIKRSSEESSEEEEEEGEEDNPRHSIFERVAASSISARFSGTPGDKEEFNQRYVLRIQLTTAGFFSIRIILFHPMPGMTAALSRRRVSCRELVLPDCDGWLWKKRKESSVFIAQKWQRFWFVLKGPSLYWYTSQQDEKAEGFVNIASYIIESAGEHKRKYVFKMRHQRFHNFFFAADNVSDMKKLFKTICYSETESETEVSPSPRRRNKVSAPAKVNTLFRTAPEDEMGKMLNNIKEGGVSLMGQEQPFTHDHFRRSFIRRNKNPVINEKAHTLRALQSTLKAKEAELQQINKILEGPAVTASKYRQWKEQNEELVQEIERLVAVETVATETSAAETKGAYRLKLSDGEELVDAEPSDVLLELPQGSPRIRTSSFSFDSFIFVILKCFSCQPAL